MSKPKTTAGILSLATYIPKAFHDAEFIASQSETPAEIIRTKLGWRQATGFCPARKRSKRAETSFR